MTSNLEVVAYLNVYRDCCWIKNTLISVRKGFLKILLSVYIQ